MASPSSSAIEWENRARCRCKGCTIARQQGREDAARDLEAMVKRVCTCTERDLISLDEALAIVRNK